MAASESTLNSDRVDFQSVIPVKRWRVGTLTERTAKKRDALRGRRPATASMRARHGCGEAIIVQCSRREVLSNTASSFGP
jgi:hypothetical protein